MYWTTVVEDNNEINFKNMIGSGPWMRTTSEGKFYVEPEVDKGRCAREMCWNRAKAKCARCKAISYCSKPCSDTNWKNHKVNCKKVVKLRKKVEDEVEPRK